MDDDISHRPGHLRQRASVPAKPVLRLRRAQDLIEAVPYLLGFHPTSSVVIVGLASEQRSALGRVTITARLDIEAVGSADGNPAATDTARAIPQRGDGDFTAGYFADGYLADGYFADDDSADEDVVDGASHDRRFADGDDGDGDVADAWSATSARSMARQVAESVAGSGAQNVVGIVFAGPDDNRQRCTRAMRCVARACERAGLEMADWFVKDTPDGASAPPGVIATEATYAGLVARPDRRSVVALLEPAPPGERERLRPALHRAESIRRQAVHAGRGDRLSRGSVRALFRASRELITADDAQIVRLGAALADVAVRDACWLAIDGGRIDGENLWRELARRLPPPYDAPPLFLFGWLRWRAGDGALAGIAAKAALVSDPDYRAAALLAGALAQGMDPFRTPKLRKGA